MNLAPDSLMFGVAPAILVDCATQLRYQDAGFDLAGFSEALGAPTREAEPVLHQMVEAGFVEHPEKLGVFLPTKKLRQLALASVTNGVPRTQAEQLLNRVLLKAASINAHPEDYACPVLCLAVFGSYLTSKPVLGDLDIGVELGPEQRGAMPDQKTDIRKILNRSSSASNQTIAALRLRKPKLISVHLLREVIELGTPFRVVFGKEPPHGSHR